MKIFLLILITSFLLSCITLHSKQERAYALINNEMSAMLVRPDSYHLIDSGMLEKNYISTQYSDSLYFYCDTLIKISRSILNAKNITNGDSIANLSSNLIIDSLQSKINCAKFEQRHQFNGYKIEIKFTAKDENGTTSLNRAIFYFDPEITEITEWDEYNNVISPYI